MKLFCAIILRLWGTRVYQWTKFQALQMKIIIDPMDLYEIECSDVHMCAFCYFVFTILLLTL